MMLFIFGVHTSANSLRDLAAIKPIRLQAMPAISDRLCGSGTQNFVRVVQIVGLESGRRSINAGVSGAGWRSAQMAMRAKPSRGLESAIPDSLKVVRILGKRNGKGPVE